MTTGPTMLLVIYGVIALAVCVWTVRLMVDGAWDDAAMVMLAVICGLCVGSMWLFLAAVGAVMALFAGAYLGIRAALGLA